MKKLPTILIYLTFLVSQVQAQEEAQDSTVITSDRLEMNQAETENYFYFYDNVIVDSVDFHATSDQLEVIAAKEDQAKEPSPSAPVETVKVGAIKKIIAIGSVTIIQEGRKATAGKAVIFPDEQKIILTDSPVVTDEQGTVAGFRMTLLKGESKAIVEGDPNGARSKIVLPSMPEFGVKKPTDKPKIADLPNDIIQSESIISKEEV